MKFKQFRITNMKYYKNKKEGCFQTFRAADNGKTITIDEFSVQVYHNHELHPNPVEYQETTKEEFNTAVKKLINELITLL